MANREKTGLLIAVLVLVVALSLISCESEEPAVPADEVAQGHREPTAIQTPPLSPGLSDPVPTPVPTAVQEPGTTPGSPAPTLAATSTPNRREECATGVAVADVRANPGLVSDCNTLLAARDTLAGNETLNWSADRPIRAMGWYLPSRCAAACGRLDSGI